MTNQNKNAKEKGITLIALIITIIVMLILVGVTINVVLDGGLFTTAKEAAKRTQLEAERETLQSAVIGAINTEGKVDFGVLVGNLPNGFTGGYNGVFTSTSTGNTFEVSLDGTVKGGENSDLARLKKYFLGEDGTASISGIYDMENNVFKDNPNVPEVDETSIAIVELSLETGTITIKYNGRVYNAEFDFANNKIKIESIKYATKQNADIAVMMQRDDNKAFWQEQYRTKIASIEFVQSENRTDNAIEQWSVGISEFIDPEGVIAYITKDESNTDLYKLTISSPVKISLPSYSYRLFAEFTNLNTIKFNNVETSNVNTMSDFFYNDSELQVIEGINSFNTSNVENMQVMFFRCSKLASLDLTGWDTSKVTNMSNMFNGCSNLSELKGLANWNVSEVKKCDSMFNSCAKLTSLDLRNWYLAKIEDAGQMFAYMSKLENLYLSNTENANINLGTLATYKDMFKSVKDNANIYVKDETIAEFISARITDAGKTANIFYGPDNTEYTKP